MGIKVLRESLSAIVTGGSWNGEEDLSGAGIVFWSGGGAKRWVPALRAVSQHRLCSRLCLQLAGGFYKRVDQLRDFVRLTLLLELAGGIECFVSGGDGNLIGEDKDPDI